MSEYIYADILKADANTAIAKNIYIQVDKMEAKETADYQGVDPHFIYKMCTRQIPINDVQFIQQRCYVIDQKIIDKETGQLRKYLIISDPQPKTLLMEWSWIAYKMRGT